MEQGKEELELYRSVAAMTGDILFRYDIGEDVMELFYGRSDMSRYGSRIADYLKLLEKTNMLGMTDEVAAEQFIRALTTGNPSSFEFEIQLNSRTGTYRWFYVIGKTEYGDDNEPKYLVGKMRDIEEQKYQSNTISRDLKLDGLTCVLNKEYLEKRLSEKCHECDGKEGAGAIISIDGLKELDCTEDKYLQDKVIVNVAQSIERAFAHSVIIGRLQYDEFAVVYFGNDVNSQFLPALEDLMDQVGCIDIKGLEEHRITLSIGVYSGLFKKDKEQIMFEKAMKALNTAKYQGKGNIVIYSEEKDARLRVHSRLLKASEELNSVKFDQELVEQALEIMSSSGNIDEAVKHIFSEIGQRYGLDRIVVREVDSREKKMAITYNWINSRIPSITGRLTSERLVIYDILEKTYQGRDIVIVDNIDKVNFDPDMVDKVRALGMKSFVHCIFKGDGQVCGCIGFESYTSARRWKNEEIKTFRLITKLVSSFLLNMRSYEAMLLLNKSYETHDVLTGLYKFEEFRSEAGRYTNCNQDTRLAILYTEMKEFSRVNDEFGYDTGDQILKGFAEILKNKEKRFIMGSRMKADHFIALIQEYDNRGNKATAGYVDRLSGELQEKFPQIYEKVDISLNGAVIPVSDPGADIMKYMERAVDIVRES